MNTSELYDAIVEAVETPVPAEIDRTESSAGEVAVARKENTASLSQVRELLAGLKRVHPSALLEKLQRREVTLTLRESAIARAESYLVTSAGPSAEDERLAERIKQTMHREQQLIRSVLLEAGGVTDCRSLPTKFIRGAALAHFRREVDEAQAELDKLRRKYSAAHVSPAGRTSERMRDLQGVIGEWPRTEKLCRLGEEVHALREERKQLNEERARLKAERRREALAV